MNAAPITVSFGFNAAACKLAETIWYARATAFDLDVRHWSALDNATRVLYVEQAQGVLNANRPVGTESALTDSFVGLTRAHAARVVGRITEKEPYGVSRNDANGNR